jgi:CRP/FNR family cyclic AMP-dependent transcriptional regulator
MLDDVALFSDLSAKEREALESHAVVRKVPKNTFVLTEGDHSDSLYLIQEGKVKICLNDEDGKEVILNIQGPGEYFGELALLDEAPRSASVVTLEPTRLTLISKSSIEQCVQDHPAIALSLIRSFCRRIRGLSENVRNLALHDVYQRVANTLQKLAVDESGRQVIPQRLTHQDIANMVGASREMVSKIMKELTTGNYISIENKRITIERKLPARW